MNVDEPVIFSYATPKSSNRVASMPATIILAIIVPGLGSSLIRGSIWMCVSLSSVVAVAFCVFGPLWGEVLFPSSPLSDVGLYPFLVTWGVVEIVSVVLAIRDRNNALKQ